MRFSATGRREHFEKKIVLAEKIRIYITPGFYIVKFDEYILKCSSRRRKIRKCAIGDSRMREIRISKIFLKTIHPWPQPDQMLKSACL